MQRGTNSIFSSAVLVLIAVLDTSVYILVTYLYQFLNPCKISHLYTKSLY